MPTLESLPLKPRVFFLDTNRDYGLGITGASLASAMLDDHTAICWFSSPTDAAIEDLLSPLYDDPASPLRPGDAMRAAWEAPVPGGTLSPKSLSQILMQTLPDSIPIGLLNLALKGILSDDHSIRIIIPDAAWFSINGVLSLNDIPRELCCAIRLRPDDNTPHLPLPLACQSIMLLLNSSLTDAKIVANLLQSAELTAKA